MEAIRYYIKGAFRDVVETPQVLEQQEELIADMTAKVDDLVAEGRSHEEALGLAIASVGDLSALVAEFGAEQDSQRDRDLPRPVPTACVDAGRLDFHATAITVGIVSALMLGATTVSTGAQGWVAVAIPFTIGAAIWWMASAFEHLKGERRTEVRELRYLPRILKSVGIAAGVSIVALLANLGLLGGLLFWAWPIWIASTALPIRVLAERQLIRNGWFLADGEEPTLLDVFNEASA